MLSANIGHRFEKLPAEVREVVQMASWAPERLISGGAGHHVQHECANVGLDAPSWYGLGQHCRDVRRNVH
jgi:hypothetical protein